MDVPAKTTIRTSPYTVYGGYAAEDLKDDSTILLVICPELLPHTAFGSVAAGITTGTSQLKDRDGNPVSSTITSANHIAATWEGVSNQRYAPMVRKGEPVEVYKSADQDKYLWRTTGRGRDFRTTDRFHFEIGATDPTKPAVAKDDTNTYQIWMDSQKKTLGFKSSKMNGEAAAFSGVIDAANGTVRLSDDGPEPGNRFFMDAGTKSSTPILQVNLSTGVAIKMQGNDLYIKVPGKCFVDVTDRLLINSPMTIFNKQQAGAVIFNAAQMAFNAAKDVVVTAGNTVGINAVSSKVTGMLVAGALRAANAVKGAVGSAYQPVTVQRPEETPAVMPSNTPDTSQVGASYNSTG